MLVTKIYRKLGDLYVFLFSHFVSSKLYCFLFHNIALVMAARVNNEFLSLVITVFAHSPSISEKGYNSAFFVLIFNCYEFLMNRQHTHKVPYTGWAKLNGGTHCNSL